MKRRTRFLLLSLVVLISLIGIGFGIFYFYFYNEGAEPVRTSQNIGENILKEYTTLKIFYPLGSRLELTERKVHGIFSTLALTDILIKEYLALLNEVNIYIIPDSVTLNNLFITADGVVYLDFSRDFQKVFQVDVIDEYMLIKSIFQTLVSNIDINNAMILVEGKEIETIGGHFIIDQPLKEILD